jgi:phenylalanyl-tRNA synthetase beta chain
VVALLADRIGAEPPTFRPLATEPILHPGRSATVEARFGDGEPAITGIVGELHPRLADAWDLRGRVVVAELSITGLGGGSLPVVMVEPLPRVQPIERDLTVDVPDRVPAADVVERIREEGGPLLQDAALTGTYRGKPLRDDERSLTYRLQFGAPDRALQEQEVDAAISTITASLEHHLGARIRS